MIITIASPDKLSIAMFLSFLKRNIGSDHILGETHSLMDYESTKTYVNEFLKINPKAIFTYYAKRKINIEPLQIIPTILMEVSEAVIWFNLYETSYKLLKDKDSNFNSLFLDTWNKNVSQLGGA